MISIEPKWLVTVKWSSLEQYSVECDNEEQAYKWCSENIDKDNLPDAIYISEVKKCYGLHFIEGIAK